MYSLAIDFKMKCSEHHGIYFRHIIREYIYILSFLLEKRIATHEKDKISLRKEITL